MTDAEVLASFMEPRPEHPPYGHQSPIEWGQCSPAQWWWPKRKPEVHGRWYPRPLTLNECHEIEARLTDEQVGRYDTQIRKALHEDPIELWVPAKCHRWHIDAATKVAALAAVLRPLVEAR